MRPVKLASWAITADVTARIPRPFFFSPPRTVTGAATASRTDTTTRIDAVWMVPSRTDDSVTTDVGGWQAGGGVRVGF